MIDSIRNTFLGLLDDASKSYMWEYHQGGVDSMYFTLALGKYSKGEVKEKQKKDTERELEYSFAPEILAFKYSQHEPGHVPATYHSTQGSGWFEYKFQPEDADSNKVEVDMGELVDIASGLPGRDWLKAFESIQDLFFREASFLIREFIESRKQAAVSSFS